MLKRLFKRQTAEDDWEEPRQTGRRFTFKRGLVVVVAAYLTIITLLSFYWDVDTPFVHPPEFNVRDVALKRADGDEKALGTGYVTTSTLIELVSFLLDKPGGFLSNDVMPPFVFMDNTHSWEWGVVIEIRDFARVLRNDLSRSQSQSPEDWDLGIAEPALNNDITRWMFPSIESRFQVALDHLTRYLARLGNPTQRDLPFYARADNLREWLSVVGRRLGSLSQRLGASVGRERIDVGFAAVSDATHPAPSPTPEELAVTTPWLEIDDVFYEARGHTFALSHLLRAIEIDFASVLNKKNAIVSLRQIIRELESTHETLWSPMVLNGSGFGVFANHSLVMASYVSRANSAVIELVHLLEQG